ncbi:MAG TPA: carboxypeptidase regulatory-like domain-containing protein, partial [Vicinamibacterales bacterium]|nr:carboxypeptidase regulatory-like domain-containing protein [Vicinamibacterales bacterium]
MKNRWSTLALLGLLAALISVPAFAQGTSTSSLAGVVVDSSGGALPGATIEAKNNATGGTYTTVSSATGDFNIPALPNGTYTVTVSLPSFKTSVLTEVVLNVGVPTNVRATLEVGSVSETVEVTAAGQMVKTQTTTISSTISTNEIANTPLTSRYLLDFVTSLPGVSTPGGSRASQINGLDQSAINITLDGINIQDNTLKTGDGFFAIVSPRLDAIEEVTVSGAAQTADAAGTGAVQIKFVTRAGSNSYTGSGYWYYRSDVLNANTYFNERDGVDKAKLQQNQPGFRVGGPIVIPGLYDGHNQAFFFVNYEEFRQPSETTRTRTILSPLAQQGIFQYVAGGGTQQVNLFQLAAANGLVATPDPVVAQLLADIRSATQSTGSVTSLADPNVERYTYNVNVKSQRWYPTFRVDVNLSEKHRVSGSFNYNNFKDYPDTLNSRDATFPGFPVAAGQSSKRYGVSTSLRSTFTANMVNEVRIGGSGAPVQFFGELNKDMWSGPYANQAGFELGISNAASNITNASPSSNKQSRNAYTFLFEDTLNWQKGTHALNVGGSYSVVQVWLRNGNLLPSIGFDLLQADAAKAVLNASANFPGSSSSNRNDAEDLYAVLVGSVVSIGANAAINPDSNQFEYLRATLQEGRLGDYAFWFQDAWRPRPDLTFNLGVRWELQTPFRALNASYSSSTLEDAWGLSGLAATCTNASAVNPTDCNLFKPGVQPGKPITEYYAYEKGREAYNMDWNNLAPSVGVAWTPAAEGTGWWSKFLGSPGDSVVRAGWSRAFQRNGMSDFTGRLDDNPGLTITATRNESNGNIIESGASAPLLLRETSRLGAPPFQAERIYPMTDINTGDVGLFDPNIQVPYADTWSAGWQRALGRNMAVEVRYVGTRGRDLWRTYNYNELNVIENGIVNEFRNAQANLQANIAAGRGANFRYYGAGTGTVPLPLALAYFSGRTDSGNAAAYSAGDFASSTFVNPLAAYNPNVFTWANNLDGTQTRINNALVAGLPANFLVANPDKLGGVNVTGNGEYTKYHSLQIELRRRMSNGLMFNTSYVYGKGYQSDFYSFRVPRVTTLDEGGEGSITHAFKGNWVYELPFGQGRRFAGNSGPVMDRLVGGWQIAGTFLLRSGQIMDFGNVRMVGFDKNDLNDFLKVRIDSDGLVTFLPQDVIENTVK